MNITDKRLVGMVSLNDLASDAFNDLVGEALGAIAPPGGRHNQGAVQSDVRDRTSKWKTGEGIANGVSPVTAACGDESER